jgi:hypothetical protein
LDIRCSSCGVELEAAGAQLGQLCVCPDCGEPIPVPMPDVPAPDGPPLGPVVFRERVLHQSLQADAPGSDNPPEGEADPSHLGPIVFRNRSRHEPPPGAEAAPPDKKPRAPRQILAGMKVCPNCGHVGMPVRVTKGSFAVELVLWLCFFAPGLLYSLWRLASRYAACSQCQAPNMIPASSPRGRKITAALK